MPRQFTTISPTHVKGAKRYAWAYFRDGNYVAVGWLKDLNLTDMSDEQIRNRLELSQELNWVNGQTDLVLFANHLRIGDLVAVNNTNHGLFGIGVITSEYRYRKGMHNTGEPADFYSHFRKVRWLTTEEHGKDEILRPGEKAWEPYGTVGKIKPEVPEYIWRLLSNEAIEDISESLTEGAEEAGEFKGGSGQGFQSDPRRRKAVERYSMQEAIAYYELDGFQVEIFGKPYDLKCTRNDEVLYVEVKGTESAGDYVFLTRNEVDHSRRFPMELFVLSGIKTSEASGEIIAQGGVKRILKPWKADDTRLEPYAYIYQLR